MTQKELLRVIEEAASEGATELDLSGKELTVLPPEIGKLTQLKKLILGKYKYNDAGDIVDTIGNKLSALPAEIGQLHHLEELQVVDNRLSSLPQEFGQLTNLQTLDLSNNQLSTLPQEFGQLTNLQTLDLSNNQLSTLPQEFGQLTNLQTLDLSNNQLSTLPQEFGQLINLQTLYLSNNELSALPAEFGQLTNLQTLYLYDNQLSALPAEFGQLTNLQTLYLYDNQLSALPAEFGQLTNLQTLYLSNNELSALPAEFGQLTNLQTLYLHRNRLSALPAEFGQLTNLQTLYLRSNQLSALPAEFGQLTNLQTLDLYNNELSALPAEIVQLTNLQTLDLTYNELSALPAEIVQLTNLQTLDLTYNELSALPAEIVQLTNLKSLDLRYNQLSTLPAEFGQLTNLQSLDLSNNQLSTLPQEIGQLTNLQTLYLSNNQLSTLPQEIGQLTNLQTLQLSYNQLSTLPAQIRLLTKLEKLDLRSNPVPIPPEILGAKSLSEDSGDVNEILDFYFRVQDPNETEPFYEAKFLIVGEGEAGKTSLANKIADETYELDSDEKSTQGIDVIQWNFTQPNGQPFRVNIWDFGGQEIYHETHQFFLTKRSLYALVADTRKENTDFYWWLKVVKLLSDNSPVMIIENEKQDRQSNVPKNQLRGEFANLKEILATNLATNRGLSEIKNAIENYISKLPHVGTPLPKLWVRVRSALENNSRNYISLEEYRTLCRENKLTDREDMLRLSRYLHDLGVCLHFQDDPTLKHYVILKPEWGTTAVYKVLDNDTVRQNQGHFTQDDLVNIWNEVQYADMQDELLQLMMRFKLCYKIPNRPENLPDTYIAPHLLSVDKPNYVWDETNNLILRYKYEFMPKGILTRFIVETYPWIDEQKLVWKNGVVLNKDQTRAEVIENYNQTEIKIRVAGNRKKELLAVVTSELEKIHQSFERLQYKTFVPCNCSSCQGSQTPHDYPMDVLRRFLDAGQKQIQCQKNYQMVDVRKLIDDVMNQSFDADREPKSQAAPLQQQLDQEKEKSLTSPSSLKYEKEIFISYTWRDKNKESESYVEQLEKTFQAKGIKIIRDTNAVGDYKARFKEFMERIGRGKWIIAVISDEYLKSENCMFELVQIAKNGDFYKRIFPIILSDAKISKPRERIKYIQHWEEEIKGLDEDMKTVSSANLQGFREDIDLYTNIRNTIAELTNLLRDMNTLTPEIHSQSEFEELLKAIEKRLDE